MNLNITLTEEMNSLIEESNSLFRLMQPMLPNGKEKIDDISVLNQKRVDIDLKLGSLLRELVANS